MKSLILLSLIFLSSCKTFEESQVLPNTASLEAKLPALEKSVEDFVNSNVSSNAEVADYFNTMARDFFTKEVETNLSNPYGKKYGYIVFSSRTYPTYGIGYALLHGFTFGILIPLGVPVSKSEIKVVNEIRILNSKRELIGKYESPGESTTFVACYWGYNVKSSWLKSFTEAMNKSFDSMRASIRNDAPRLIEELTKAGPLAE